MNYDIGAQIENDKEIIKKIQSSSAYMKLIKCPNNLTLECFFEKLHEINKINNNIPYDEYDEYDEYVDEQDEMTGIMSQNKKQKPSVSLNFTQYEDGTTDIFANSLSVGACYGMKIDTFSKNGYTLSKYQDFEHTRCVSTTQTISKSNTCKNLIKLHNSSFEQKIYKFNLSTYDAITNIIMFINNNGLYGEKIEFVLKCQDLVICSRTLTMVDSTLKCNFIDFPNFIINPPGNLNKLEVYIRANNITINDDSLNFTIIYDVILFDDKSRSKIFGNHKPYLFETSSGIVCMGRGDTIIVPRYSEQVASTVHPDFKHLYSTINKNDDNQINNIINENIKIIL
ncbi:hypothetical protein Indivirus_6_24 [Indivirus ILV1]|uniref:Uncharacterized protein n=1 Tax=Indivirus ILV1 TaxID=1977633 RepID=A0A1V0SE92_9VIRU|nr:hypothetical protein Indivirus_6_24 [Indivirus ILV1]